MSATANQRVSSASHSFDYCRLVELAASSPLDSGCMVSLRPGRRTLSPQTPERHGRRTVVPGPTRDPYSADVSPPARAHPGTPRRQTKFSTSCSDNHGIRPPPPEQYLTPLQQKELCIRHLRARLQENVEKLQDRDAEVEELRAQLWRMQEDWVEEECRRVEAQLALKEARCEIQQLQRVVEAVRSRLGGAGAGDEGFRDISAQNHKLDALLLSMELAQEARPAGTSWSCGASPSRSLTRSSTYTKLSCEALPDRDGLSGEETLDSGFVGGGSRADLLLDPESESPLPRSSTYSKLCADAPPFFLQPLLLGAACEQAVQTDGTPHSPEVISAWTSAEVEDLDSIAGTSPPPSCALQLAPPGGDEEQQPADETPLHELMEVTVMEDDEEEEEEEEEGQVAEVAGPPHKSYWSRLFVVDLLAVGLPVVPALAWLCRAPCRAGPPICNIGSLLRGCCTLALHSLRRGGGANGGPMGRVMQI